MAERVILHIGAPKSGTTYLQTTLWNNRERLRASGLLLPGPRKRSHDVVAFSVHGDRSGRQRRHQLLAEIRQWPGAALLSSEWFSMASDRQVGQFVSQLAPATVEVVFTARRFVAAVPAAWSQTLKSGKATELEDFVRTMDFADAYWNWGTMDAAVALEHWRRHVPVERIHVVTVPPPGTPREELWQRFASACRISSPGDFDRSAANPNESLSAEAARLLQLVGPALREALQVDDAKPPLARLWISQYFSRRLLLPQGGHPIKLEQGEVDLLQDRGKRTVAAIEAAGYRVVGDLADLIDSTTSPHALHPRDVDDAALLRLTETLLGPMLARISREYRRANRAERRLRRLTDRRRSEPTSSTVESTAPPARAAATPRRRPSTWAQWRGRLAQQQGSVLRSLRRRLGPVKRRALRRGEDLRRHLRPGP